MTDREHFDALRDLDPTAREAKLAAIETPQQERVRELLAAEAAAGSFLEADTEVHATAKAAGSVGTIVAGKYKLLEAIGEGGMGTVWRAQQLEPVKRLVALKLVKPGMDSKTVLARFEAERQALALMDYPNIAKVLDAGLADDRRPYFVMELVKGVPIAQFCDARKLTPRERLELFVPVCQAIQHAHQKGIIHRDIKPNNVLVALYDDRAVPKVIDFGVAKATGATLTELTIDTGFGGIIGTPQYMSPEQATFNNLDIDTRSDIYSLGVVLYELLTGSPPFSRNDLEKQGILEVLRIVREEEPPRPSTKLSTADALPTLSANRSMEPKKLAGLLRHELDWIVMKALEKDRARRYDTANGFAADIQRYLAGEPVQAHPPSTGYRLRKFLAKNRGPAIAAMLLLAVLTAGIFGTTYSYVQARDAEARAVHAQRETEEQYTLADFHRRGAESERDLARKMQQVATTESFRATQWSMFCDGIIHALTQNRDPATGDLAIAAALDELGRGLEKQGLDPNIEVLARERLGYAYAAGRDPRSALIHFARAKALREKLAQPGSEWLSLAMSSAHFELGDYARAEQYFESIIPTAEKPADPMKYMAGIAHRNVRLAEIKMGLRKFDEAVTLLTEVEAMHAKKEEIRRREEEDLRAREKQGQRVSRSTMHSDPKSLPELRALYGDALAAAGRAAEAKVMYRFALDGFRVAPNRQGTQGHAHRASLKGLLALEGNAADDIAKWTNELASLGEPAAKGVPAYVSADWAPPGTYGSSTTYTNGRAVVRITSSLPFDRVRQFYVRRVSSSLDDLFSGTDVNVRTGERTGSRFNIQDEPDASGRRASTTLLKVEDKQYVLIRVYLSRLPDEKAETVKVNLLFLPRN